MPMEPIIIFSILCGVLFLLVGYLLNNKNKNKNYKLPPGNTGLPLIGETWTFLSMMKKGQAYQFIAERKRKYSEKIFRTSLLGQDMAVMCTPEGNKLLFSNEGKLVRVWWPAHTFKIFTPYKKEPMSFEESKKDRISIYGPFLRPDCLRKYVATVDSMTKKSIEVQWANRRVVKARELVSNHVFALACRLFLSLEDPERVARLRKQIRDVAGGVGAGIGTMALDLPGTKYWRARKSAYKFVEEIKELIKIQRDGTGEQEYDDLVSYLLNYRYEEDGVPSNNKSFTHEEVASKVLSFIFGATDTSSTLIVSVLYYLAQMPSVYNLVRQEQVEIANSKKGELLNWEDVQKMTYSWNVVKETLRLSPHAPGGYKEVIKDFEYEGFHIPRGWKVHWNVYASNRNPEYFPDPDTFDPSRFEGSGPIPYTFIPFGGGPRMCPGNEFARMQVLVIMHNLITNFKWEKVYPDEKLVCDPLLLPTKGLPLRLYPHKP